MKKFFNNLFSLNKPLLILLATNSSVLIAIAMLAPIWAIFIEDIGGDILETGLAAGALAVTAGIVVIFTGKFSDTVKHNELIVALGYVVLGVGFVLYNFVSSLWFLVLVQVIVGVGIAIYEPSFDSVYSKHLKKKRCRTRMGSLGRNKLFFTSVWSSLGRGYCFNIWI